MKKLYDKNIILFILLILLVGFLGLDIYKYYNYFESKEANTLNDVYDTMNSLDSFTTTYTATMEPTISTYKYDMANGVIEFTENNPATIAIPTNNYYIKFKGNNYFVSDGKADKIYTPFSNDLIFLKEIEMDKKKENGVILIKKNRLGIIEIKINDKNQLEYVKYSFDSNDKYKATRVYSDYNNTVIEVPFDNLLVIK